MRAGRAVALLAPLALLATSQACAPASQTGPCPAPAGATAQAEEGAMVLSSAAVEQVSAALAAKHGPAEAARVERGVRQAAMFWRAEDGSAEDFSAFCLEHFIPGGPRLDLALARFDRNLEALSGHRVALTRLWREPNDLDLGEQLPVDLLFAGYDPFDHFSADAFSSRIAFAALLNWELPDLPALLAAGPTMTRAQWAAARLAKAFSLRIPGPQAAAVTAAYARADDYIAKYNIWMGHLRLDGKAGHWPADKKLISHWGLRDEIKALYSDPLGNLPRQRLIQTVMERIVRQEIPAQVIDNPGVDWDPRANLVYAAPGNGVAATPDPLEAPREEDTRFARLLEVFKAQRGVDAYSPAFATHISRRFDRERELPEAEVQALLEAVLGAPVAARIGQLISQRLGRPLEPFDIWYDGFKARGAIPEERLTAEVRKRFPDAAALQAGLPGILRQLGFGEATAAFLASKITVDASRGAGHAMGAGMRSDNAHLRTRVPAGGLDYKGFNIAMHELGHCVEQVLSLNKVDWALLAGVPNTAFTEAFAFLFQGHDLQILGLEPAQREPRAQALMDLDSFWMTYEIAGVGLLDMAVWRWLYAHPTATPAELRQAVVAEATAIWDRYYAPVLGVSGSPLLAIYSHMIAYGLYLPDYPIGHLLDFQYQRYMAGKDLGQEMERMAVQGSLTPAAWMQGAVGAPLSARPLIEAAERALGSL